MGAPKLSKLEFQIMEALWGKGEASASELSIREILDSLPSKRRPAYTTIQTTVYRMEAKGVVKRVRKVGNFHLFAAAISRDAAQRRLIDELLALFGGRLAAGDGAPGRNGQVEHGRRERGGKTAAQIL